jgi:hypothetical protein
MPVHDWAPTVFDVVSGPFVDEWAKRMLKLIDAVGNVLVETD